MYKVCSLLIASGLVLIGCGDDGGSNNNTVLAMCGNGIVEPSRGEVCDDGNTEDGDDCTADCRQDLTQCGNLQVDPGEGCDDGSQNSETIPDSCRTNCQPAGCGDYVVDTDEVCDDGNTEDGDGCSAICHSREICSDGILTVTTQEECDDGNIISNDGCSVDCKIEERSWRDLSVATPLPFRYQFAMAHHRGAQHTVLFGGRDATGLLSETWIFDGTGWEQAFPVMTPQAREEAAMAYDPQRHRVVMFGGRDGLGEFNDTWEWDGSDWEHVLAPDWPTMRARHGMAYDTTRGRTVLACGNSFTFGNFSDTWSYDGVTWTEITPSGDHPESSVGTSMGYLYAHDQIALYVNNDLTHAGASTIWTFDGNAWTYRDVLPSESNHFPIAVDWIRSVVVIPPHISDNLTWEWDGSSLSSIDTDNAPSEAGWGWGTYDSGARQVLFQFRTETWAYGYAPIP